MLRLCVFVMLLQLYSCLEKGETRVSEQGTPSLQSCVLGCLGNDIFGCISEPEVDKHKAYFMNTLIDHCLLDSEIGKCFEDTFLQRAGTWCEHLQERETVATQMNTCYTQCRFNPISVPRQNTVDFETEFEPLESASRRSDYEVPQLEGICKDPRFLGFLCSDVMANSRTAGNSLCRVGHSCGYHGQGYYWCYTTNDNHWDYCCTGSCDYHGMGYLHCQAGDTWQYCGDAGTRTAGGATGVRRNCRSDHPCGLHRDQGGSDYYWCRYDSSSWDYCCSPREYNHLCDYHGSSYTWCKHTYHRNYVTNGWSYCHGSRANTTPLNGTVVAGEQESQRPGVNPA